MLGELRGKIPSHLEELGEKEDFLTDSVFSPLRYGSPAQISTVLSAWEVRANPTVCRLDLWPLYETPRSLSHEAAKTEPDVELETEEDLFFIEVKYKKSKLDSMPLQLARLWMIGRSEGAKRGKRFRLLTLTIDPTEPSLTAADGRRLSIRDYVCSQLVANNVSDADLPADDDVAWASWASVTDAAERGSADASDPEKRYFSDVVELLSRRSLAGFKSWKPRQHLAPLRRSLAVWLRDDVVERKPLGVLWRQPCASIEGLPRGFFERDAVRFWTQRYDPLRGRIEEWMK